MHASVLWSSPPPLACPEGSFLRYRNSRATDYLVSSQKIMHGLKRNPPYTKSETFLLNFMLGWKSTKDIKMLQTEFSLFWEVAYSTH